MTAFNFVDDPRGVRYVRNPRLIEEFTQALVDNPDQWAEFPVAPSTAKAARMLAHRITHGVVGCPRPLRNNRFEATARDGAVYVRYNAVRSRRKATR